MNIQSLNSNISFGKQAVGEFNVNKMTKDGKIKKVPVTVYRLDSEDCEDCFTPHNVRNINMGVYFKNKTSLSPNESNYIVEKKENGKLLGIADCIETKDNIMLSTIGTSKKKKYSGIGRALLAGIVQDIKGKYQEIEVPTVIPSAQGFYENCHFDCYDSGLTFCLDERNYGKLIHDAQKV